MARWTVVPVVVAAILLASCSGPEATATPVPTLDVACVGVPHAACDEVVASFRDSGAAPIVQVTVTCTSAQCTTTDGEVQLDVLDANGQRSSAGSGYGNAQGLPPAPAPALPVAPICLGLPFTTCRDLAGSAIGSGPIGDGPGPPVARITVRCKGICTPTKGEGETRIDYVDGTNQVSSWGYQGSG